MYIYHFHNMKIFLLISDILIKSFPNVFLLLIIATVSFCCSETIRPLRIVTQ